jgi:hypothetical protein
MSDAERRELTARLAEEAGLTLAADRLGQVDKAFAELLALAATLEELPLDGAEPALGRPRWQ